ncbi:MAG: hypothetical protein AAF658_07680, partial [Myxococcota bacterium]
VGATRRLVANLTVDECLQKRKSALAAELLREVSPVVGGAGRAEDATEKGWGVVIDTIEIQEVRVLSDSVFAAMQAPYRRALEQRAHEAQVRSEREIALHTTQSELEVESARVESELEMQRRRRELDEAQTLGQKEQSLLELHNQAEIARVQQDQIIRRAQEDIETHTLLDEAARRRRELARDELNDALDRRERTAAIARIEASQQAESELESARALAARNRAQAELVRAENLPELAAAVGQRFGEVKITQLGQVDGSPFGGIAQAVAAVLDLAKSD